MVNEYAMGIHYFIAERIETASSRKQKAEEIGDVKEKQFFDGQLHELIAIREYISKHFDLKTQPHR